MEKVELLTIFVLNDFGEPSSIKYMNLYNRKRLHSAIDYQTLNKAYFKWVNDLNYNSTKVLLNRA